ncbi:Alginate export [Filimonas lacunae]|uniref:Alginate export n=1 Tax=Filimonas lacunae TaxID=477680 RepID=A0A173MJG5_9BACT|nr:alginate export family protein [Filimonas lacunae]BAV07606.1 hypothetical protein FLA_3632 [Filimonas lacunae]SIT29806.1 Alginate export [Filimonas lacunae]
MKSKLLLTVSLALAGVLCHNLLHAQLNINAQLRTRTEFRNGQGAPLAHGADPAFFTSQRTRLGLLYNAYRIKLGLTVQDARVWGQDASTINRTTTADNNGLLLHEAWAEIQLTDTVVKNQAVYLKIGRQELVYDDQRLLGNLDWLQQARRHDAAVLKYETAAWKLHAGFAFNQNKENAAGTIYNSTPAGNNAGGTNGGTIYKSLQYLYAGRQWKTGSASFLFLADQFNKFHYDTVATTVSKVYDNGAWNRMTTGVYFLNSFRHLTVSAGAYYQLGRNASGQKLEGGMANLLATYEVSKPFTIGAGFDYTSGGTTSSGKSKAFDPLYGTPHKFWGLMDYFYAASAFGNTGLLDYYLKLKWKPNAKSVMTADVHQFASASAINNPAKPNGSGKSYGQEVDLVYNYAITQQVTLEAGYSHFFTTPSLAYVKNVSNAKSGADWAYVMINIKPSFLFK